MNSFFFFSRELIVNRILIVSIVVNKIFSLYQIIIIIIIIIVVVVVSLTIYHISDMKCLSFISLNGLFVFSSSLCFCFVYVLDCVSLFAVP